MASAQYSIKQRFSRIVSKESHSRIYRCVREICDVSPRYVGTDQETRARDYIFDILKEAGIDAHLEDYEYLHYMPGSADIQLIFPVKERMKGNPVLYTQGSTEGSLVYAGSCSEQELAFLVEQGLDLSEKIVMANVVVPFTSYSLVEKHGACGFIAISDAPENLTRQGTATFERRKGSIPGIIISAADGLRLLTLLCAKKEVVVRLSSYGTYSTKTSSNVVGVVEGSKFSSEKVTLGGHYDTLPDVPGAWDNASGVSVVLEIARIAATLEPERTIECIFFSGEEVGCWGSWRYVETHKSEMSNCLVFINSDAAGSAEVIDRNIVYTTPNAKEVAINVAEEMNWPLYSIIEGSSPHPFSDHTAFALAGVPVVWYTEPTFPEFHTKEDVISRINSDKLVRQVELVGRFIWKLVCEGRRILARHK